MYNTQTHIINKVIVDVNTKSKKTAFTLKDNLDVFLKEEIFPYMEAYFKTLEKELPSEIIQIPKLTLEVTGKSENNFEDLKANIKAQVDKEIKKIINNSESKSSEAVFISTTKSKEEAFIYFLEKGIIPWWETVSSSSSYNEKELDELLDNQDFIVQFKRKIKTPSVRNRFIKQFSNTQKTKLLKAVFKSEIIILLETDKVINQQLNQLKPKDQQWIWQEIIQYSLNENKEHLTSKLTNSLNSKSVIENNEIVEVVLKLLQAISGKTENNIKTIKTDGSSEEDSFKKEKPLKQNVEVKENHSEEKIIETREVVKEQKTLEANNTTEKNKEEQGFSKGKLKEETKISKEKPETKIIEGDKEIVKNTKLFGKSEEGQKDSENKNQEEKKTLNETKELLSKNEKTIENNKEEIIGEILKAESKIKESKHKEGRLEDELIGLKNKNNSQEKSIKEEADLTTETSKTLNNHDDNEVLEASKVRENTLEIIQEKELEELFVKENKGEYYVKNAGLILLHPYLKNFFANCELLNDTGKIINPELAIHLLHYLATKKEQQYESNMVFEKFLCGIAIEQSITREIIIPEALKLKAETLLEAVITHWEALNNPSTDLLRNEFLQRAGKLSFKNENPKIIVERKVFDLLLDKLPWTLSLSKLPWIDKLIYTDW